MQQFSLKTIAYQTYLCIICLKTENVAKTPGDFMERTLNQRVCPLALQTTSSLHKNILASQLGYFGHLSRRDGNCLKTAVMSGQIAGSRGWGRLRTTRADNIKTAAGKKLHKLHDGSQSGRVALFCLPGHKKTLRGLMPWLINPSSVVRVMNDLLPLQVVPCYKASAHELSWLAVYCRSIAYWGMLLKSFTTQVMNSWKNCMKRRPGILMRSTKQLEDPMRFSSMLSSGLSLWSFLFIH